MEAKNNYAVIMAGGVGTRFWPMSRTKCPKQFIDVLGTGKTLIQQTFNRLRRLCPEENIIVVTNKIYKDLVAQQLPEIPLNNILCEPCRRNTAPCICYAYNKIITQNTDAQIIVAPSDHIIMDEDKFVNVAGFAMETAAHNDCLITIGITPSRPDTGYGYIQINNDDNLKLNGVINKVASFREKPDLPTAMDFLADGSYVWNAGIFIWSAKAIQKAFSAYLPEIEAAFATGKDVYNTSQEESFVDATYEACQNISIDYGIMEKADNVYVYRTEFGWSDLGTWVSLFENSKKNEDNNAIQGEVVTVDSSDCIIKASSNEKLVVVQGLSNYIVVDTPDSLLICSKDKEQHIKDIVSIVEKKYGNKFV